MAKILNRFSHKVLFELKGESIKTTLEEGAKADADLRDADLRDADLKGADLRGADLKDAYLRGADLKGADLRGADLRYAYLRDADLKGAKLPHFQIPQTGTITVFKAVGIKIVEIEVPFWARRTASLVGRKCRCSAGMVVSIDGRREGSVTREKNSPPSGNGPQTVYTVGKLVYPDGYDPNPAVECTHGLHFFLTREEAEEW